ncbi:TPA: LysR family transcriptional regulator [Pseudomonas putida]|jgi:DNA-binding transcriptional LysR family regulator|uniref:Transcriptional regulator, LysR family n=1 Tax=Pseudomonas putida (strain GB-1) TaxID=76869 RepID=B0KGR9_PSEPG|nr:MULTISPECIES: LysR family transcriptional regulator [Pseudomonas]ABZ00465.1 transcriptional regulator, LysR family [Pseudomonas putida GB-1]APF00564.1 LysR family transcriptional regulator [Pseudomonas putida]MBP0708500.1 LysR family transcriptional regulator [Pseudomonas sp. T34]MCE0999633.1 LysR family transcriptional regulator [Pseudomonas sp. NMI1173_11]MCK2187938.1 LysR family transcriptional regulator [Pseudomonas sp. MB04B]
MQLPDMNLLVALDVLLDEGSVVGAAQRMNLSPAAMSRTLGRIREAMGDPILVRAGRGLVPTPRALALREQVHGLVEQAGQVFRSRDDVDLVNLDRAFNIRTNDLFIALYGAQLLSMMLAQAPRTVLRFVPEGSGDDDAVLRNGHIDLIISSAVELGPEIKVQSLFSTYFVGLARVGHPIFDAPITPERFAAYPQISVSRRGRANGPIDVALANHKVERRVALITTSFHSAMFSLPDSDLILPIPANILNSVQRLKLPLRSFEIPVPLEKVNVKQAWHPRFDNDPAHRWLRQTLKACGRIDP